MNEKLDFQKIGFKSGLEVHVQINTEKKLFCRCPAGKYTSTFHSEILRHMRPTLSELGEYDRTALMEFKTKKNIVYRLNRESVCTYEMDDTPPFLINQDALDIAIEMALLLNCKMAGELHVIRKQYLDGSIPTGFQRTAIVGLDGELTHRNKKIRVIQLAIEEDSCREISDKGHKIVFTTDRLSIPLIEIVTQPDMKTPKEVADVGESIRKLTRTTGHYRRGPGTARQDLNVSINGGRRVEIKGVPSVKLLEILSHREALRQKSLLEIRDILSKKGIKKSQMKPSFFDVKEVFIHSNEDFMHKHVKKNGKIKAAVLPGLRKILGYEVQPGRVFADEIEGRVRVIACIDKNPVFLHNGEIENKNEHNINWEAIRKDIDGKQNDGIIIVWGSDEDTRTAMKEIEIRVLELFDGIPPETRQVLPDGNTDFERILPGADRMYPDTDSAPFPITDERIKKINEELPDTSWEKIREYQEMGLDEGTINVLLYRNRHKIFDRLTGELKIDPKLTGRVLSGTVTWLSRKGHQVEELTENVFVSFFKLFNKKQFTKEIIPRLLTDMLVNSGCSIEKSLKNLKIVPVKEDQIRKLIEKSLIKSDRNNFSDIYKYKRFIIGKIMQDARGKIDGKRVKELLDKAVD